MKKISSLLIFLFQIYTFSFSQNFHINFEYLTTEQGLSSNTVFTICQDKFGFLWIGAENGLNRYDGYDFKLFKYNPIDTNSLSNNKVWDIIKDKNGTMWFATEEGLCSYDYDKERFVRYYHNTEDVNSLGFNMLRSLYVDSLNNLWIGTYGGGLDLFDQKTKTFRHFKYNPRDLMTISDSTVLDIYEDSNFNFWIATDGGLDLLNRVTGKFKSYHHDKKNMKSLSHDHVICIKEDRQRNLWLGTWGGGLNRLDYGYQNNLENKKLEFRHYLKNTIIQDIIEDKVGNLWVATRGKGIYLYNRGKDDFIQYNYNIDLPKSLNNDIIVDLFEDATGIIWIGTLGGGINKYDRKRFDLYQSNSDFKNINSLLVEPNMNGDIVWIGSQTEGLFRFVRKIDTYTNLYKEKSYPGIDFIRVINKDRSNRLWIGSDNGLSFLDKKTDLIHHYSPEKLSSIEIYTLFVDSYNYLWIGTFKGGLNRLDLNNPKNLNPHNAVFEKSDKPGLSSVKDQTIRIIYEDHDSILWVGTERGGLNRYDRENNKFVSFISNPKDTNSISDNYVRCIFEDSKNNLWIGTANGLNMLPKNRKNNPVFIRYTNKHGLSNNSIRGIQEDEKGNMWISTDLGISKLDPFTNEYKIFSSKDGIQGEGFADNVCAKGFSWILYFGGNNGLNIFHPDSIKVSKFQPQVIITDFKIDNISISIGKRKDGNTILSKAITATDTIELRYDENNISFEFVSLDYSSPENNLYSYILEGFDKTWTDSETKRTANYTNLDPGVYNFKVKVTNCDGIWNDDIKSIQIFISPPFWRTWWFYFIVAIILIIIIILFFRIINSKSEAIKKRTHELLLLNDAVQQLTHGIKLKEDEIIELIVKQSGKLVSTNNIFIVLYDDLTETLQYCKAIEGGIPIDKDSIRKRSTKLNKEQRGKIDEIILTRESILIQTLDKNIDWYNIPGHKEIPHPIAKSYLGVPIKFDEKVIGVISIFDLEHERAYSEKSQQFMLTLASQAAIAISNARLLQESENRRTLLELASEVGKEIGTKTSRVDILSTLINRTQKQLKCNHCTIFLPNKDKSQLLIFRIIDGQKVKEHLSFKVGEGIVGKAFEIGKTILSRNVYEESFFKKTGERKGEYRSMLAVPVKTGNFPLAIICADQDEFGFFTSSDQYFLEVLARQVGETIDRLNGLEELRNIGNQILNLEKTKTITILLENILKGAIKLTNTSTGVIYLISDDEQSIIETYYPSNGFHHPKPRLHKEESLTREIIKSHKFISIKNIKNDPRVNHILCDEFFSLIGIPLILNERVIGILYLDDKNEHEFTETEISLLLTLVGQAMIAIVNERLIEESRRKATALQAIYEAGKALTNTLTFNEIYIRIVDQIRRVLNRSDREVNLIHLGFIKEGEIIFKTWKSYPEPAFKEFDIKINFKNDDKIGIMGRCVLNDESQLIGDVTKDTDYILTDENTKSELAVLIKLGEKKIGIINVEHPDINAFDSDDQDFLEHLAAQVAIAINNAELYKKIQKISETYPSISELNISIDSVVQKIADITLQVLESDVIVLYRFNQKKNEIIWPPVTSGILKQPEYMTHEVGKDDAPNRFIAKNKNHFSSTSQDDIVMHPGIEPRKGIPNRFLFRENIKSSAGILLKVSSEIVGVLFINYRTTHNFDDNEIQIIELYSSYIALAIQNVLHFREKEIADASKTLGELTGRFAHKMKNDLASMRLYLDALLKICINEENTHFPLNESSQILDGLTKSINHLLELSKLKTNEKVEVNIQSLIEEFLVEINSKTVGNNIELKPSYDNNLPNLLIDPKQTKIVLSNLAENSIQCMENGGKIEINVYQERDTIFIEWSDTGPGINEDIKDKIFDMAFTTKQYGYGLGLFHSRAIIEEYGGTLTLDTSYKPGAKFIIRIPIK